MSKPLKHHEFKAELIDDDDGQAVMITQSDGWGDDGEHTVILHPHQLRAVCEQFGILPADPEAEKAIKTLERRMAALCGRIEDLSEWMAKFSDHKHADLSYEMTAINALADLAIEWCADFETGVKESSQGSKGDMANTAHAVLKAGKQSSFDLEIKPRTHPENYPASKS